MAVGLVDRVSGAGDLLGESVAFAEELAGGATLAIAGIKQCLRASAADPLASGLAQELEGIVYLFAHTEDCREGIRAFNEKRPPAYLGR